MKNKRWDEVLLTMLIMYYCILYYYYYYSLVIKKNQFQQRFMQISQIYIIHLYYTVIFSQFSPLENWSCQLSIVFFFLGKALYLYIYIYIYIYDISTLFKFSEKSNKFNFQFVTKL